MAVERRVDRGIDGYPVIIASPGTSRAAVYDMSEEAYRAGVRKRMPVPRALRLCPDAVLLPPHPNRYERAMQEILKEVLPYSPLIEHGETDGHLFVDVTGTSRLFGPAVDVAWRMYKGIRNRLGLEPSWSVGPNKLVAKVATRLVKPMGEYIVAEGEEAEFLKPVLLQLLPGIEYSDMEKFRELNLSVAGQVAGLTRRQLEVPFGRRAGFIFDTVRGIDSSPVSAAGCKPQKITAFYEFGKDTNSVPEVEGALYRLVEKIGYNLRKQGKSAPALLIVLDYTDGLRRFRQTGLRLPSADDITLFQAAQRLLHAAWNRRVRLRHIRLTCARPVHHQAQMELFPETEPGKKKREALSGAMDAIRERFGPGAVCMGRVFNVCTGMTGND